MYNVYAYTLLYIGPLLYHWVEDVDQNYDQRYQKSVEVSRSGYMYIVCTVPLWYTYYMCKIYEMCIICDLYAL